jgi:hypothetical protein
MYCFVAEEILFHILLQIGRLIEMELRNLSVTGMSQHEE